MNITRVIREWFKSIRKRNQPNYISNDMVGMLARMLQNTREDELSCDEVFLIIDQYSDLLSQGKNVEELLPMIKHHLEMCTDCREEFESLMRILQPASPA